MSSQCVICKGVLHKPVTSPCCQRVVGCEDGMLQWMDSSITCSLCSADTTFMMQKHLRGFNDALWLLSTLTITINSQAMGAMTRLLLKHLPLKLDRTSPLHAATAVTVIFRCQILSLFSADINDANIITSLWLTWLVVNNVHKFVNNALVFCVYFHDWCIHFLVLHSWAAN